jgi:hypothetical protein
MSRPTDRCLLEGFSPAQKIIARIIYYALFVVAILGIYQKSPTAAVVYTLFIVTGLGFLVTRLLCAHCPYPAQKSDCLLLPFKLMQKIAPYQGPKINNKEKTGLIISLILVLSIPHIWIWYNPFYGILFTFLSLVIIIGAPINYCRRCAHLACPFNQTSKIN